MQQNKSLYRFLCFMSAGLLKLMHTVYASLKSMDLSLTSGFACLMASTLLFMAGCQRQAFLYTSFHEPANQGLRFIYSKDGYHWDGLPGVFLPPRGGSG